MSFDVLGPLEVRVGDEELVMGGAKQRAVLAVLLLRAGEVVPVERLVDEVWGNDPPPSAAHTLESYVSRLRQLLNGHGPLLVRRGAGYALELGDATLDSRRFVELQERASLATAMDGHAEVVELTGAALAMWRGPALADVSLASSGRAEADRLEELRLRTYELRFDAELALGRHEQVIGELQKLVAQSPYRERFVAQLMLALYRCGRHAEALEVYEQTRRRLDDDLGLQPSADLQQLSGQVVRQDSQLNRPALTPTIGRHPSTPGPRRRATTLIAAAAVVATALALATSGGAAVAERVIPSDQRAALVVPDSANALGVAAEGLATAVDSSAILYDFETQIVSVDPTAPAADVGTVVARIRNEGLGLIVALGDGPSARALAEMVPDYPDTRFVFIDASLDELSLGGVPNAAAIRFSDEDVFDLAGYVSGRVPTMDGAKRIDLVSVVADAPTRDTSRRIAGLKRGLRASGGRVTVRVDYSHELTDKTACERLANRQIDAGADVIVALAGTCSLGALAVARFRGVWGVGALEDGMKPTDDLLMATEKEWTTATLWAIEKLVDTSLPMGRDTVLGLEDNYAQAMWWSNRIPERIASAMIDRCSEIRASRHQDF